MKTFSVAVAVAVVLTFICIQESSAFPVTEVQELEEPMSNDSPVTEHEETSVDSWKMPYNNRQKRGADCVRCCDCCGFSGCGECCRF
ncbi:hepcidin-like [Cottoperca gobio]|uniref:Hepcidin-like n=1 Tax=Cottoperca gobio TaxID=56716 RepID=A0A6J2RE69_COTGO|nr:hepcidin-like [Cottoperca gobio]